MRRYAWLSAATAALTFPLIALGAIVRLEGAGLACPDWPLCYGRVTPLADVVSPPPDGVKIALEVGHRYLAALVGLFVVGLVAGAWTKFRRYSSIRVWSAIALGLLIPQALLGALTVWMELAPITVSLHLISGNLFFGSLLVLTLQAFRASRDERDPVAPEADPPPGRRLRIALVATLLLAGLQIWLGGWVSSSGASMVCPSFPTCDGTWALPAGYLEWLQMGHRAVALLLAAAAAGVAWLGIRSRRLTSGLRALVAGLPALIVAQILLGWFNVAHYVPVPTSALHTALAATIFGLLTYLVSRTSLGRPSRGGTSSADPGDAPSDGAESDPPDSGFADFGGARANAASALRTLADYRALTKPRIVHLLVLTAFCTMLVAADGLPDLRLVVWTVLGTVAICGSAQVVNMVWDRDIDAVMERTADRPIVQGRISSRNALVFSALLGLVGTALLAYGANWLAALMGVIGHVYYSVVYTMWLKRRTPQNIVIGGGAGAFPTLIGWVAVTGSLSVTAGLIFAVVFLWTPPHFWALALYKETDYEEAGVPMMPVTRGPRTTKFQMLLYTSLLIGVTALLGIVGMMGILYFATAILLGAGFAFVCVKTAFSEGNRWAKRTFAYSIAYLALLFGAMSVDSLEPIHFTRDRQVASTAAEEPMRELEMRPVEPSSPPPADPTRDEESNR